MKIYKFSLINTFLTMVRFFSIRKNASMAYSENFDAIIGTDEVRKYFQGKATLDTLKLAVEKDLFKYYEKAKECFLYNPHPTLSKLYVRKGNRDK